jgi:hypothetical protein
MKHALVKLGQAIDRRFLEERFGAVYTDKPGQPPLPTRLMTGLAILKHTYDLSDEALCDRLVENPCFQYFCGEEFFQHALVFDRSSLTRWRQRMGKRSSRRCCRRAWRWRPGYDCSTGKILKFIGILHGTMLRQDHRNILGTYCTRKNQCRLVNSDVKR